MILPWSYHRSIKCAWFTVVRPEKNGRFCMNDYDGSTFWSDNQIKKSNKTLEDYSAILVDEAQFALGRKIRIIAGMCWKNSRLYFPAMWKIWYPQKKLTEERITYENKKRNLPVKYRKRKSAVPYKSTAPHRHKPSRPLQTVKLPKSQMPSRQTEEHQALLRTNIIKASEIKTYIQDSGWCICDSCSCRRCFYGWNILSGNYFGTPEQAFDSSEVFTNALAAKENMRTESFAQKLCVSSKGNVWSY